MNVLSLFDGMGCAWIALRELGLNVDRGYSSEIDRHAIHQVEVNFPEVERLGDVTGLDVSKLERIDLLMGGSPCQSFSFAGKRKGMVTTDNEEIRSLDRYLELKRQGFRFEGQSYLFWEYVRILNDIRKYNPDVLFLLENVEMVHKWLRVIYDAIGIMGVRINSGLVSAQCRKRIYWTNIRVAYDGLFDVAYSDIPQPEDRGILLADVLDDVVDAKYFLSENAVSGLMKHRKRNRDNGNNFGFNPRSPKQKMNTLAVRGDRMYDLVCLPSDSTGTPKIRRVTPAECARLQTIPAWYKWDVSEAQQYKLLGNGWTVEVIKHILGFIRKEEGRYQT